MKRLLLLFILLSCVESHAIEGSFKLGYYVKNTLRFESQQEDNKFVTNIKLRENFKYLSVGGNIETFMTDFAGGSFHPDTVIYKVFVETQVRKFTVGFGHDCWHGINRADGIIIRDELYLQYNF